MHPEEKEASTIENGNKEPTKFYGFVVSKKTDNIIKIITLIGLGAGITSTFYEFVRLPIEQLTNENKLVQFETKLNNCQTDLSVKKRIDAFDKKHGLHQIIEATKMLMILSQTKNAIPCLEQEYPVSKSCYSAIVNNPVQAIVSSPEISMDTNLDQMHEEINEIEIRIKALMDKADVKDKIEHRKQIKNQSKLLLRKINKTGKYIRDKWLNGYSRVM